MQGNFCSDTKRGKKPYFGRAWGESVLFETIVSFQNKVCLSLKKLLKYSSYSVKIFNQYRFLKLPLKS